MKTQNIVASAIGSPDTYSVGGLPLPSKIFEWTVQDTVKNILATQSAAKTAIIERICKRFPLVKPKVGEQLTNVQLIANKQANANRKQAYIALNDWQSIQTVPWLHRYFRDEYKRGHCRQNRQIVYQGNGYSCTCMSRYVVKLEVQGLERGKRIELWVKSNRTITGQIRVIRNDAGELEIHHLETLYNRDYCKLLNRKESVGVDRGHTEVFWTSDDECLGDDFGKQLNQKTERITRKGCNKNKLWALAYRRYAQTNPELAARIQYNNLGNKTELKRRCQDDAYVETVVNQACKSLTSTYSQVFVEELVEQISSNKSLSRRAKNRLNKWEKGTVADRLSHWAARNLMKIEWVNAAYTSQVDHRNGTLLGSRNGDSFTGYDGVVLQADWNASLNVLAREKDKVITRYMKYVDVQEVLLRRTAAFLKTLGKTLLDAVEQGLLDKKHTKHSKFKELVHGQYQRLDTQGTNSY